MTDILESIEEKSTEKIKEKQRNYDMESPPKSFARSIMRGSMALAIIIGFVSILTKSSIGILVAGVLAIIAFIALLFTPFTEERKKSEVGKNDRTE